MQHLGLHLEWRQGSCVLGITWCLFILLQDGEMSMMLQDPILLGKYDVSEEGIVEFDTHSFIEETTTDKFQIMEIYI